MRFNRKHRLVTTLIALVGLLFMQLAVANYVCPVGGMKLAATTTAADASMPCADSMPVSVTDTEQPNLCQAHCQSEAQASNTTDLPMPVDLAAQPYTLSLNLTDTSLVVGPALQTPHLRRTTAPPLSIQNCCLRI
jgi:hypothetical protein